MKESKTLFICAAMNLIADALKLIVNIGGIYPIHPGWATDMIFSIVSVWFIANSKVKNKVLLTVCGAVIYISIAAILATMEIFGLVELS